MDLKNFIKKKMVKDNTRFLVQKGSGFILYVNLTELTKYLRINEMNIEKITVKLLKEKI